MRRVVKNIFHPEPIKTWMNLFWHLVNSVKKSLSLCFLKYIICLTYEYRHNKTEQQNLARRDTAMAENQQ